MDPNDPELPPFKPPVIETEELDYDGEVFSYGADPGFGCPTSY
jgi:hypothetical protein